MSASVSAWHAAAYQSTHSVLDLSANYLINSAIKPFQPPTKLTVCGATETNWSPVDLDNISLKQFSEIVMYI